MALLGEGYSLIATDTRAYRYADDAMIEDDIKLHITPHGWVCGMGDGFYIKNFEDCMRMPQANTDEAKMYYYKYSTDISLMDFPTTDEEIKEIQAKRLIDARKTILAYAFNSVTSEKVDMSIELWGEQFKNEDDNPRVFITEKNKIQLLYPSIETDEESEIQDKYIEQSKTAQSIHEYIYIMAGMLSELSKLNDNFNDILDVGISCDGKDGTIILLQLREKAERIIQEFEEKKNLISLMKPCSIITSTAING